METTSQEYSNRITVFKHLTVDELTSETNMTIVHGLLDEYYTDFVDFCDSIAEDNTVESVSCYIEDGQIRFNVTRKEEE